MKFNPRANVLGARFIKRLPLSLTLSRLCGCNTYFKLENLQMAGGFKECGALNKLLQLSQA